MQNIIVDNAKVIGERSDNPSQRHPRFSASFYWRPCYLVCEGDQVIMMNSAVYV
jgi:hypothetical protein